MEPIVLLRISYFLFFVSWLPWGIYILHKHYIRKVPNEPYTENGLALQMVTGLGYGISGITGILYNVITEINYISIGLELFIVIVGFVMFIVAAKELESRG